MTQATVDMHLFGHAIAKVISSTIKATIDSVISSMLTKPTLDAKSVVAAKNEIDIKIAATDNSDLLPTRREVSGSYRGVDIHKTVKSIEEEVRWRMAIAWKGLAVQQSVVQKLWCEDLGPRAWAIIHSV